jgi:hypothetical protein
MSTTDYPEDDVPLFMRDENGIHALSETGSILATTFGTMSYPEICNWAREKRQEAAWADDCELYDYEMDLRNEDAMLAGQAGRGL